MCILTNFRPIAPIKPAASVSPKKPSAGGKLPIAKTASATPSAKVGEKTVEVKQILMTKAQIEDMKRQGKIKMKDGRLCIFKK